MELSSQAVFVLAVQGTIILAAIFLTVGCIRGIKEENSKSK